MKILEAFKNPYIKWGSIAIGSLAIIGVVIWRIKKKTAENKIIEEIAPGSTTSSSKKTTVIAPKIVIPTIITAPIRFSAGDYLYAKVDNTIATRSDAKENIILKKGDNAGKFVKYQTDSKGIEVAWVNMGIQPLPYMIKPENLVKK